MILFVHCRVPCASCAAVAAPENLYATACCKGGGCIIVALAWLLASALLFRWCSAQSSGAGSAQLLAGQAHVERRRDGCPCAVLCGCVHSCMRVCPWGGGKHQESLPRVSHRLYKSLNLVDNLILRCSKGMLPAPTESSLFSGHAAFPALGSGLGNVGNYGSSKQQHGCYTPGARKSAYWRTGFSGPGLPSFRRPA